MYVQVFQQYSKAVCMNLVSQGLFCLWCEVNLWAADHLPLFKKLHLTVGIHISIYCPVFITLILKTQPILHFIYMPIQDRISFLMKHDFSHPQKHKQ